MKKELIVIILAGFILSACAATPTRRAFKEGWRDSVATSEVKWKLTRDRSVHAHNINVDTWRGVVTLNGRATSAEEKAKAEELARRVKNVKDVRNYLDVVGAESVPAVVVKQSEQKEPVAVVKPVNAITEEDLTPEPVRNDSVSHEIRKDIALETGEQQNDVTSQAERELKELKAKKKK